MPRFAVFLLLLSFSKAITNPCPWTPYQPYASQPLVSCAGWYNQGVRSQCSAYLVEQDFPLTGQSSVFLRLRWWAVRDFPRGSSSTKCPRATAPHKKESSSNPPAFPAACSLIHSWNRHPSSCVPVGFSENLLFLQKENILQPTSVTSKRADWGEKSKQKWARSNCAEKLSEISGL